MPQVELLSHSGVKAGLTHCGFGGIQEYINAGIPMVCMPHFGDQGDNARLIEEQGIGLKIIHERHAMRPFEDEITFEKPLFTQKDVTRLFRRILTEDSFKIKAKKLQY